MSSEEATVKSVDGQDDDNDATVVDNDRFEDATAMEDTLSTNTIDSGLTSLSSTSVSTLGTYCT